MAYPTTKDDLDATRGTGSDTLATPSHVDHHTAEDTLIEALQDKVGINSSADTASLDYQLNNAASTDPGHTHTPTTSLNITGTPDGTKFLRDDDTWAQPPTVADASTTVKGSSKLSVAPVSASDPIAVGDNDTRVPTQDENDGMVGTSGTAVSSSNKLVDADDVSDAGVSGKIVRATGTSLPALDGSNLTNVSTSYGVVANENISANDMVRVVIDGQTLINASGYSLSVQNFGQVSTAGGSSLVSRKLTVGTGGTRLDSVVVDLKKTGAPTDNAYVTIEADSGGNPDGTPIATSDNISGTGLTTSYVSTDFTFSTVAQIPAGTYWVVFQRSGSLDSSNYYALEAHNTGATADVRTYTNGAWQNNNPFNINVTYDDGTVGRIRVAQANDPIKYVDALVGFASGAITSGNSGSIVLGGVLNGFTGLTVGKKYYLSDTAGAISTTAGTNSRIVGVAVSTTSLLVNIES